ncbi:MAG TPA: hypothetical protein VJQ26_08865 [Ktedonobacteraceae bacterium]|nr:hypothetical protein [Ktedonobacteraceae bacterium]
MSATTSLFTAAMEVSGERVLLLLAHCSRSCSRFQTAFSMVRIVSLESGSGSPSPAFTTWESLAIQI